jgi:hypothetical protein
LSEGKKERKKEDNVLLRRTAGGFLKTGARLQRDSSKVVLAILQIFSIRQRMQNNLCKFLDSTLNTAISFCSIPLGVSYYVAFTLFPGNNAHAWQRILLNRVCPYSTHQWLQEWWGTTIFRFDLTDNMRHYTCVQGRRRRRRQPTAHSASGPDQRRVLGTGLPNC